MPPWRGSEVKEEQICNGPTDCLVGGLGRSDVQKGFALPERGPNRIREAPPPAPRGKAFPHIRAAHTPIA
jgi:hypothetical protein